MRPNRREPAQLRATSPLSRAAVAPSPPPGKPKGTRRPGGFTGPVPGRPDSEMTPDEDPVAAMADPDGLLHYRTLGVAKGATAHDIRRAYRARARALHPDKGGDPAAFARLQEAFETLHDPRRRDVYDAWAHRLR